MKILTSVLCFVFSLSSVYAKDSEAAVKDSDDVPVWSDLISPLTTDAKYVFWYGAAATLVFAALEDQISDPAQKDVAEDRPLGDFSHFGDLAGQVYPNALYSLGMLFHGMLTGRERSYDRSKLMFKATLYSSAVTTALKYSLREPRPKGHNRDSFPSGHTTTAFAFASVVGAEHDWPWGLAAYTMAAFVGFSRMNDNNHYLHDVIGGAVIGASYGLSLYYRQQQERHASNPAETQSQFQILPTDGLDGAMVLYSTDFSF